MRERIHTLTEKGSAHDIVSRVYDCIVMGAAILSIFPLMFKGSDTMPVFQFMDHFTVYILFLDYILRWISYDYKSGRKGIKAFLIYPFTGFAVIDLLSMLPSLGLLGNQFRILRMLRIFKLFRYSNNFEYILRVFKKERKTLASVVVIALAYIFVSALAMFTYEPDTFDNFFGALYWATTALTTVGYGDVYPLSSMGRLISMVSSLFGIAVIALPAGIITAGFMDQINRHEEEEELAEDIYQAEQTYDKLTGDDKRKLAAARKNIKRYALWMLSGIVLNQGFSALAKALKLPVWLDTTGTILVTLVLEPAAGLLVGLADNFYLSIIGQDSSTIFYYVLSVAAVLITGNFLKQKGAIQKKRIIPALLLVIIVSTILSTALTIVRTGGLSDAAIELHYSQLALNMGVPVIAASAFGVLVIKTFDTLATFAIVWLIYSFYQKFQKTRTAN